MDVQTELSNIGIVPVVKITRLEDALPLAASLYNAGIHCAEITFRSEYGAKAIQMISAAYPDMTVGAGTIHTVAQAQEAVHAGAKFLVTPGFQEDVVTYALAQNLPIFPGVSTASEIEMAMKYGLRALKFFPAESSGGVKKLKDLSAPYAGITFMPTGGINLQNLHSYLSLPNVFAIGGSFMLPQEMIDAADWDNISALCKTAISSMLRYELIHIGIHSEHAKASLEAAKALCNAFDFQLYKKPKANFAGRGFEILHTKGIGEVGHIGIYTPYPERALYQLALKGIHGIEETITRNKKTQNINFVYLDFKISGFGIHLINPDVKM